MDRTTFRRWTTTAGRGARAALFAAAASTLAAEPSRAVEPGDVVAEWSALASSPAEASLPLNRTSADPAPSSSPELPLTVDSAVTPTGWACSSCGADGCGCSSLHDGDCGCNACCACSQPINWTAGPYFKSGVNMVIGQGMLEGGQSAGYVFAGGYRQPLAAGIAGDNVFVDLGGSYLSAFGETTRTTTGNLSITGQAGIIGQTPNAFSSTLTELQRATVHTALGYYWGAPLDVRGDWDLRLVTRFGGRAGHMRGVFDEVRLVNPAAGTSLTPAHDQTDATGGIFVSGEAVLLQRRYSSGSIQLTAEAEFANDWVNFAGFKSSTLGTGSILFGVMFSR